MHKQNNFMRRLFIGGTAIFLAGFVGGWYWRAVNVFFQYLSFISPFYGN
jgi:hypothetical protein